MKNLNIAFREARETRYWLKIIKASELVNSDYVDKELTECGEIIGVLTSSVKSSKLKL